MIFGLSYSTILTILIAAVIFLVVIRIVSGLLRLAIAVAILGIGGYWIYTNIIVNHASSFIK